LCPSGFPFARDVLKMLFTNMENTTGTSTHVTQSITSINGYLAALGGDLAQKILDSFPPLHRLEAPLPPLLNSLRRNPYAAQLLVVMRIVRRWEKSGSAAAVAECDTGKTLTALASMFVHSHGKPFCGLRMSPPHLVDKWAREAFQTIPGVRVFIIDGLRDAKANAASGVNEVKLRHRKILPKGLKTSLTDLRLRKNYRSAPARWNAA